MKKDAKIINYFLGEEVDMNEFQKIISFISEDIVSYELVGHECKLYVTNSADEKEILNRIKEYHVQFVSSRNEQKNIKYQNSIVKDYYEVLNNKTLFIYNDGAMGLNGKALFLFNYFDNEFKKMAHEMYDNCIDKLYPVLLNVEDYAKTGYLRRSPQHAIFCSNVKENIATLSSVEKEIMNKSESSTILAYPHFALSPSACFHVYAEYHDKVLNEDTLITFTQSVFRNEGRLNFGKVGRLRDYHVREIVFLGKEDFVITKRNEAIDKVCLLMEELELCGNITSASDSFIMPKMQKFKKIQMQEEIKYEVRLNYDENNLMAVASFNLHGDAFSHAFNIRSQSGHKIESGCIGFGLERWVICFLAQYGEAVELWPSKVREEYINENS